MLRSEAGVSSPVRKAWVGEDGREAVTYAAGLPSPRRWNDPLERQEPVHLVPATSRELPERCCRPWRTALGAPTPDGRLMDDGRIPKELLCGELAQGKLPTSRPQLRYKDVCKRGLKGQGYRPHHVGSCSLSADGLKADRLSSLEQSLTQQAEAKRKRRKARGQADRPATDFTCVQFSRDCHSRVGLSSHARFRRCISITTQSTTP